MNPHSITPPPPDYFSDDTKTPSSRKYDSFSLLSSPDPHLPTCSYISIIIRYAFSLLRHTHTHNFPRTSVLPISFTSHFVWFMAHGRSRTRLHIFHTPSTHTHMPMTMPHVHCPVEINHHHHHHPFPPPPCPSSVPVLCLRFPCFGFRRCNALKEESPPPPSPPLLLTLPFFFFFFLSSPKHFFPHFPPSSLSKGQRQARGDRGRVRGPESVSFLCVGGRGGKKDGRGGGGGGE